MTLQHLRSSTANKRPDPTAMADGQIALNTAAASPGLFYKDSAGNLVKAGPVHVGSTAPNVSPASGGTAGNSTGESWLDTSGSNPLLKVWNGSSWQTVQPVASGTVVSTADTGSVTSTMIADGTIVNADVNASAAIAGTKISPDFGSQNVTTTGTATAASLIPSSSTVPTNGVYLPAANTVGISTGGSGRLFVDASGNVGVGQSSPAVYFDIFKSGATQADLRVRNGTSGLNLAIKADGTADISNVLNYPITFTTGTTPSEKLRITSAGLVGVGTSTPVVALDVIGGGRFSSSTTAGNLVQVRNTDGTSLAYVGVEGPTGGAQLPGTLANAGFIASGAGGSALQFGSAGSIRATLDSSGRLGIGTSSPVAALDVNGRIAAIAGSSGTPTFHCNTDTNTGINLPESDRIQFVTGGVEAVRIDASQRVGIGVTGPSSLLSLGNLVSAQKLLVYENPGVNNSKYGFGIQSGEFRSFYPSDGVATFGTISTSDGSTFSEKARLDSSGRLLVGTSTSTYNISNQSKQAIVVTGDTNRGGLDITGYTGASSTGTAPEINFNRSSGSTDGSVSALDANPWRLGVIRFNGANGSGFGAGAEIAAHVDALAWGSGDHPSRLVFSTTADGASSPTERMRIRSNGAMWGFSTDDAVQVLGDSRAAGTTVSILLRCAATAVNTGSDVYRVLTNGNVQNSNNSYGSISDLKLKENIVDATPQWSDIKALQVRKYNFKEGQTHTQIGLVAQEVELVSPGLVTESPDRDAEGNDLGTVTKSVNYSVLYMKAVKALQEAMERIETLEAKVAALESA